MIVIILEQIKDNIFHDLYIGNIQTFTNESLLPHCKTIKELEILTHMIFVCFNDIALSFAFKIKVIIISRATQHIYFVLDRNFIELLM